MLPVVARMVPLVATYYLFHPSIAPLGDAVIAATLFSYIGFIIRLYNDEVRKQLQFVSLLSAFCMPIVRKVTVLICNYG